MKLEQQVCSLELAKRLKELGVKQESYFWWNGNREWVRVADYEEKRMNDAMNSAWVKNDILTWEIGRVKSEHPSCEQSCAAFTVAELGEMLPTQCALTIKSKDGAWLYPEQDGNRMREFTEADARAKLLVYLLENKLIPLP